VELISDDLQGFVDWNIGEKPDNIKANEGIWGLKIYRLQQLYEVARILNEGFRYSSKKTQYLIEKTSQGLARWTNRTYYRPQRNDRFVDLGKTIQMWRFGVVWSQLVF
jgi:hypothetical protein